MLSNEERIARLESINEGIHRELGGINSQLESLRPEIRDVRRGMESRFNTLPLVYFLLWIATIGTMVGFFVTG
jgi:hypothetical protein